MPDEHSTPDPPKCARCSELILDGELVVRDRGDWLHDRCRRIARSSEQVRSSKRLGRESRKLIDSGKERIEGSQGLRLREIAEHVAATAQQHVYCFPCLALQLRIIEPHVRIAAQILVLRGSFYRAPGVCYSCRRTDDVLVARDT